MKQTQQTSFRLSHEAKQLAFPISEFSVCSCGFLVHPL
jgi:hypothetical protein